MPRKIKPKPSTVIPQPCHDRLGIKKSTNPRMMAGIMMLSILKAIIWPVTVEPMLAPKIIPSACTSVSNPALIKPITITVDALDEFITAVTTAPETTPMYRLIENRRSMERIFSPATMLKPSPIIFMP